MQKEIDLLELGHEPARCLHGENVVGDEAERISRVAGRAFRAKVEARHRWFGRTYGGHTGWRELADRARGVVSEGPVTRSPLIEAARTLVRSTHNYGCREEPSRYGIKESNRGQRGQ